MAIRKTNTDDSRTALIRQSLELAELIRVQTDQLKKFQDLQNKIEEQLKAAGMSTQLQAAQPPPPAEFKSNTVIEKIRSDKDLAEDANHQRYLELLKDPTYRPVKSMSMLKAVKLGLAEHAKEGETELDKLLAGAPTDAEDLSNALKAGDGMDALRDHLLEAQAKKPQLNAGSMAIPAIIASKD
jgi:hypothetical protein